MYTRIVWLVDARDPEKKNIHVYINTYTQYTEDFHWFARRANLNCNAETLSIPRLYGLLGAIPPTVFLEDEVHKIINLKIYIAHDKERELNIIVKNVRESKFVRDKFTIRWLYPLQIGPR